VSDPGFALQFARVTVLKATGGVGNVGARVYDEIPPEAKRISDTGAAFPYITVGDDQMLGDDVECGELSEAFCRIHVWSRATGFTEAKTIAGAIRTRLRATPPVPSGFTVLETQFVQTQSLVDPDGLTRHVVLEFRFQIQHG
jgi:hypothetical protein